MIRSKPPFYKQEIGYSCAPACLRMVLGALGVEIDEASLRQLSDCTPLGTDAFLLIEAARRLGFPGSRKHALSSLSELSLLLEKNLFPIVYVDLWPIKGGLSGQHHSLVVIAIDAESVTVIDPMKGETTLSRVEFQTIWREMNYLTLVIDI